MGAAAKLCHPHCWTSPEITVAHEARISSLLLNTRGSRRNRHHYFQAVANLGASQMRRRPCLDRYCEALRNRNYLPILFDFAVSGHGGHITETLTTGPHGPLQNIAVPELTRIASQLGYWSHRCVTLCQICPGSKTNAATRWLRVGTMPQGATYAEMFELGRLERCRLCPSVHVYYGWMSFFSQRLCRECHFPPAGMEKFSPWR